MSKQRGVPRKAGLKVETMSGKVMHIGTCRCGRKFDINENSKLGYTSTDTCMDCQDKDNRAFCKVEGLEYDI